MSAWMVSHGHITLLVEACFRYEIVKPHDGTPDAVGQMLWRENRRSVNARYEETHRTPTYRHDSDRILHALRWPTNTLGSLGTARELVRVPHLVYKQLACYEYQSCEHAGWKQSDAYRLIQDLRLAVLASMGMTEDEAGETDEWATDPWGLE